MKQLKLSTFCFLWLMLISGFIPIESEKSSSIGDIKYSILPPDEFKEVNIGEWRLLNGSEIIGSDLYNFLNDRNIENILWQNQSDQHTRIPDATNKFIRSMGNPNRKVGSEQKHSTAKPQNSTFAILTSSDGTHKHKLKYRKRYDYNAVGSATNSWGGIFAMHWNNANITKHDKKPIEYSHDDGGHSHDIETRNWDSETRPNNLAFYVYIKLGD